MDDFGIDLDKVLDDFEKNEDTLPGTTRILVQTGVGAPINPPSYHEIAADMPAPSLANETQNQFSNAFYQDMSSGVPSFNGVEPVDLKTVPGSGIFDMSEPGSDLNRNVQRLEQMGNGEFVNSDLHAQPDVDLYASETNIYPQSTAELYPQAKADEGHFIPDDAGQVISGSPFGYETPLYGSETINSNSEPFPTESYHPTDSGTEILQAASELHAHIGDREDRPSFMSSSPPPLSAFHHPDIIPSSADSSQASNENQSDSGVSSEQGESNMTNAFMNASPIHRSNPTVDNSGVPSLSTLHDIAQHSYTVPSVQDSDVTHCVSQLDIDPVQNTNHVSNNLNSGSFPNLNTVTRPEEASCPMNYESGDYKVINTAEHPETVTSEMNENICNDHIPNISSAASVTPTQELKSLPINPLVQQPFVQNTGIVQQEEENEKAPDPELSPTGVSEASTVECTDTPTTQELAQFEDNPMQPKKKKVPTATLR